MLEIELDNAIILQLPIIDYFFIRFTYFNIHFIPKNNNFPNKNNIIINKTHTR